ncbi:N-acetylmuramoyl-L-alanine amidase [Nocardia sp. NPDC059091]|uniref:N-acetylmuramoyl-L-alanine amidase n=1 Tax=unclassified Nocardia TaxID=2637762 RepID=UPI0036A9656F
MKPSITKAGICTAVTAAAITTVAGIVPVAALAAPALPELPQKLAGKTIFLDPGHQGDNHTQDENKQVSDGRGGTKACQTTGMTSLHGVAEHTINWNVAQLVRTSLEGLGAHVVMSRPDDTGWGGCIDDRAKAANASGADIALSIHADSGPADGHGFHLIVPALPVADAKVNEVQGGAGLTASKAMRDAYVQSGYQVATYNGAVDGLQTRSDIAGPALTAVPDVFLEMGNGANAEDAQQLESPEGQLKHAVTITTGIASYLLGVPVPADAGPASEPGMQPGQQVPAQPAEPQPQPAQAPVPAPQAGAPVESNPAAAQQNPAAAQTPQAAVPQAQPAVVPVQAPPAAAPATSAQPGQTPAQVGQAPAQPEPTPAQQGQTSTFPAQLPGYAAAPAPLQLNPAPAPRNPAPAQQPGEAALEGSLQVAQQLADQFLKTWLQSQTPGTQPQTAPQPGTPPQTGAQPQAVQPAPQAQTKPVARPIADQLAPQRQSPGTTGGQGTPATPAVPGTQSTPGVQAPGAQAPGAQVPGAQAPGAQAPATDKNSKTSRLDGISVSSLVQLAVKFLGPLAKMLTGDSGLASDAVNLAYSLVSVLSSTLLSTATK